MSKKFLHILTVALFMAITYGNSTCYAGECTCHCLTAEGAVIGTFPDPSWSNGGCASRCAAQAFTSYYCCDWGYKPYDCPGIPKSKKQTTPFAPSKETNQTPISKNKKETKKSK